MRKNSENEKKEERKSLKISLYVEYVVYVRI